MSRSVPSISVVIPVYNEERYLGACLTSLAKLDYPDSEVEIILVDNGSTDRSLDIAGGYDVKVYECPGVTVGAVRNFGASKATGKLIVFIDSDCVVKPDWLHRGLSSLGEGVDVAGGLYLLRERPSWIERYWILNRRGILLIRLVSWGAVFLPDARHSKLLVALMSK